MALMQQLNYSSVRSAFIAALAASLILGTCQKLLIFLVYELCLETEANKYRTETHRYQTCPIQMISVLVFAFVSSCCCQKSKTIFFIVSGSRRKKGFALSCFCHAWNIDSNHAIDISNPFCFALFKKLIINNKICCNKFPTPI